MAPNITQVRDYWNARPCNIMHSDYPVGSKEYCDATEARKYKVEPHIPTFAEFPAWKHSSVLEIGCGIGTDAVNFARSGARVVALDVSETSLAVARQRAKHANVHIDFRQINAEELDKATAFHRRHAWLLGFDLVYAFGSIHHSPDPQKIVSNARELMKYGGTLKLMVYNKYSWKALWILLKYGKGQFWKFSELIARHSEAQTGCPITHVYSRRSIKKLVESAGFKVKKVSVAHIFPYDVESYKRYEYKLAAPWKYCPKWLFRKLESLIGWHLLVEAQA